MHALSETSYSRITILIHSPDFKNPHSFKTFAVPIHSGPSSRSSSSPPSSDSSSYDTLFPFPYESLLLSRLPLHALTGSATKMLKRWLSFECSVMTDKGCDEEHARQSRPVHMWQAQTHLYGIPPIICSSPSILNRDCRPLGLLFTRLFT